jgi:hypothetical protein
MLGRLLVILLAVPFLIVLTAGVAGVFKAGKYAEVAKDAGNLLDSIGRLDSGGLPVFDQPYGSNRVAILPKGSQVQVSAYKENGRVFIQSGSTSGWVQESALTPVTGSSPR